MTTYTETAHAEEFIISEANGQRSRKQVTVLTGEDLKAGTVLMDNGSGKMIAHDGAINTAGDLIDAAAGILTHATDATAADKEAGAIVRDAEVNSNLMTFPTETTAGEQALIEASLLTLGIVARS